MSFEQKIQQEGLPFGRYRLMARLAVGGMAELFVARQKGVGGFSKTVVIKCVLPYLAQDQDFISMFLSEARLAAHLNHPNVVQIFDIGSIDGIYYMAMEYIPGQNLRELTRKLYRQLGDETSPPYDLIAAAFAQVAAGLEYVHKATDENNRPLHLVHRDISPNNIILSYEGQVKIVDFGVAKARSQERETEVGVLKGRLSYMSPEQVNGYALDGRSDIFSLGVVLYELTTNRRLFRRKTEPETIQALIKGPIPSPRHFYADYPAELEAILMKMLERDPDARYQTAGEVQQALNTYLASHQKFYGPTELTGLLDDLFAEEKQKALANEFDEPVTTQDLLNLSRGSYRILSEASMQQAYAASVPPGYMSATPAHAWPAGTGSFHPSATNPGIIGHSSPGAPVSIGPQTPAITAPYTAPNPHSSPFREPTPTPSWIPAEALPSTESQPPVEAQTSGSAQAQTPAPAPPDTPLAGAVPDIPSSVSHAPSLSPDVVATPASSQASSKTWLWVLLLLVSGGVAGFAFWTGKVRIQIVQPNQPQGTKVTQRGVSTNENPSSRRAPQLRSVPSTGQDHQPLKPRLVLVRVVPQPRSLSVERRPLTSRTAPTPDMRRTPPQRRINPQLRPTPRRLALRRGRKKRRVRRRKGRAVLPFAQLRLPRKVKLGVYRKGGNGREYTRAHPQLCRRIEREVQRLLGSSHRVRGITRPWQRYVRKRFAGGRRYKYTFYPRAVAYVIYKYSLQGKGFQKISQTLVRYQRTYRFSRYRNR